MNQRSDIDRLLQVWMADGPAAIPDRLVDVVAARIGVQRQRRTWPFQRRTNVTTQIKLIAALAAVFVAVVGYSLLPKGPSVGTPSPTPVPTATAAPTATTAPTEVGIPEVPDDDINLTPGQWRWRPYEDRPSLTIVTDLPAGWRSFGRWAMAPQAETPNGVAIIFQEAHSLYSDPCHWNVDGTGRQGQPGDVVVGPSVSDLVDAFRSNSSYSASAPTPVTFGQYEGSQLEVRLPADVGACDVDDQGDPMAFLFEGSIRQQADNDIWRMYIVDVGGKRVIVTLAYYEATSPVLLSTAEAIIDSMEFVP